jgi:CheY-like chemotaxis protein
MQPSSKPKNAAKRENASLSQLSVLVVEDADLSRRRLVDSLRSMGVRSILEASDGIVALQQLARPEQVPDVVLLDLNLPRMDGIEVMRHMAARAIRVGVVLMSAAQERALARAREIGPTPGLTLLGSLSKPIEATGLNAVVLHAAEWKTAAQGTKHAIFDLRAG